TSGCSNKPQARTKTFSCSKVLLTTSTRAPSAKHARASTAIPSVISSTTFETGSITGLHGECRRHSRECCNASFEQLLREVVEVAAHGAGVVRVGVNAP